MKKHTNFQAIVIDMYVRRSDVIDTACRVRKLKRSGLIDCPRPLQLIGVGEADVSTPMVCKVKADLPWGRGNQPGTRMSEGPLILAPSVPGNISGMMIGLCAKRQTVFERDQGESGMSSAVF